MVKVNLRVSFGLLVCFLLLDLSNIEAKYVLQYGAAEGGEGSLASRSYLLRGSATSSAVGSGVSESYRLYVGNGDLALLPFVGLTGALGSSPPLPAPRFSLEQNYPNPFNPSTTITYSLAEGGNCRLAIYDVRGRLVRELVNSEMGEGSYSVRWDGRDESGRSVGSGIYLYRLIMGGERETRRMVVLK